MTNEMAHRDKFMVIHAGLHEIDLPGNPLKVIGIVCSSVQPRSFVVQAGVDPRNELYAGVGTAAILLKEKIHQFFPASSGLEVCGRCSFEPAVVAEFDPPLLSSISGDVNYLGGSPAELAFVLFAVFFLSFLCPGGSPGSALSAFTPIFSCVWLAACYAAARLYAVILPSFAKFVATAVHLGFVSVI